MALPSGRPENLILNLDEFLLNRGGVTYKTPFSNLADNVLHLIIDPNDDGNSSIIELDDLNDASTDRYVKGRDADTGAPALIGSLTADGISKDSKFWLLQYVPKTVVPRDAGAIDKAEFVLADPGDLFAELAAEIGDKFKELELDDLTDVTTRLSGGALTKGPHLPHTVGDSFLLCVLADLDSDPALSQVEYQPRSLSATINDLISVGPNDPDVGIDIHLDSLVDVNPIYDGTDPNALVVVPIRLALTDEFKDGLDGATKYIAGRGPADGAKQFDDILVYLTGKASIDSVEYPANFFDNLLGSDGEDFNDGVVDAADYALPAGWYYAENGSGGDKLEIAGVTDTIQDLEADSVGGLVQLGGVRVLEFMDTEFEVDGGELKNYGNNQAKIAAKGSTPTNIKITKDGVLYSEIPQTLTFITTVDVVGAAKDEKFSYGTPAVEDVPTEGPGNKVTPETWNYDADPTQASLPAVGDFYVIRFVESSTGAGDAESQHTLNWNNAYPDVSVGADGSQDGPPLPVRDGDMVAFGGEQWAVIGTVDTDTVAQDLQSVTERGNFTDQGIIVQDTGAKGLVVGTAKNYELAGIGIGAAAGGEVVTSRIAVNTIDFDFIQDLSEAP